MKAATLEFNNQKFQRYYVTDSVEMGRCCHLLLNSKSKTFGLDIETSHKEGFELFEPVKKGNRIIGPAPGLDPRLSNIRLIQIYDPIIKTVYVFDVGAQDLNCWRSSGVLKALFAERKFCAHNGVFELKHLTHNGFINVHVDCSMLMSIMVDRAERSPFEPEEEDSDEPPDGMTAYKKTGYGLDAVIGRLFKLHIPKHFQTSNWNAETLSKDQINYAALDAVLTYEVGALMMKKIQSYKMLDGYKVLRNMQYVVVDMELNGLGIDSDAHQKLIATWEKDHAKLSIGCITYFKKVNTRSSKQLNAWAKAKYPEQFWTRFWPRTTASTEEQIVLSFGRSGLLEVIDSLERRFSHRSKALGTLLEYKKVDKLISTYGETLRRIIHPTTRRLHCSFIIGETRTGRLSSREPNLQNLPRSESVRRLFIAGPGNHLLVADYSQIEIRAAAALSHDPVMTKAFKDGIDLHKYILKIAFKWKLEDITKDQRQLGKAINFGFQFGMGWKKFAKYALTSYGQHVTDEQAEHVFITYHKLYHVYSAWCDEERAKCEKLGFVRTPLGKVRKLLPEEQYTRSVNTQVQGGAAEVIMLALIKFRKLHPKTAKIVSTIHDEIIVECESADPVFKDLLEKCMIDGFTEVFPDAPINNLVDLHFGLNWNDAKKGTI